MQQPHQQIKTSFKPYELSPLNLHERSNHTPTTTIDLQERSSSNLGANHNNNINNNNNSINQSIRVKTPKSQHSQQNNQYNGHHLTQQQQQQQRCDSNQSATSQTRDTSPAIMNGATSNNSRTPLSNSQQSVALQQLQHNSTSPHQLQRTTSKDSSNNSLPRDSPNPNRLPNDISKETTTPTTASNNIGGSNHQRESAAAAVAAAAAASSASKMNSSSSMSGGPSYFPPGYPPSLANYPMDLMAASAIMSPHHPMFKAAALSPYFNYARLKGASDPSSSAAAAAAAAAASGMMPPVCRDPYCTGCPMSPHVMNKATGQPCPAGCTQCDSASVSAAAAAASKSYQSHSSAAAAYAHAQLAALAAASQLPYVCSWIAGDSAYCGKRFGTSDELFQHLRTHTASMSESMLNAVAATGLPPNHPLFQRTYPTPPLSPLSSARYHPYGKPSMLPPSLGPPSLAASLSAAGMPPHPSLAQYFSPYSLYGPRLGASPSMHP
ncbi:zinc finger protein Elbow isoform X2 [Condylostylus longicornis]|nr:zinc finger protein Elbow isoform X2 [Condylostylus longicornis]XP_055385846.1 zinc finger protein Elbow isoform X2 [Condylostylus longicornis]